MRNVTIALDDETALWARVEAAKNDISVSKLLARMLRAEMGKAEHYAAAHASFMQRDPAQLRTPGEALPTRDGLHER